jgi:hypothetical protein
MLAPHHWHDYKKKYGRLDEFISSHPKVIVVPSVPCRPVPCCLLVLVLISSVVQLFVVDGDFVHLREGAHAIISATTAVAKVAAAALAPTSIGTNWPPTVAVTPVAHAQFQRARRAGSPLQVVAHPENAGTVGRWEGYLPQLHMHQGIIGPGILGDGFASKYQQSGATFVTGGSKSDVHFLPSNSTNGLETSCGPFVVSETTIMDNCDNFGNRQAVR